MKNVLYFLIIVGIFHSQSVFSQIRNKDYLDMDYLSNTLLVCENSSESFFYGNNYVTNREYITYLIWLKNVYVESPNEFWEAFPCTNKLTYKPELVTVYHKNNLIYLENNVINYDSIFRSLPNYVNEYIFNPKFKNEPILGISYAQTHNYLAWMTDRYNEYSLIKSKYFVFNSSQRGEDNFNLEACLNSQYDGLVRGQIYYKSMKRYASIVWGDNVLRPAFHIPSIVEMSHIKRPQKYQKTKNHWMKLFWKEYSKTYKNKYKNYPLCDFYLQNYSDVKYSTDSISYWLLDFSASKNPVSLLKTFEANNQNIVKFDSLVQTEWNGKTYNYIQKDTALGKLPYVLLKNDIEGNPIFIERFQYFKKDKQERLITTQNNSIVKVSSGDGNEKVGIMYSISALKQTDKGEITPDEFEFNITHNPLGGTTFHSEYFRGKALKIAMKNGLNINKQDKNGETLLHQQVEYSRDLKIIKILIKAGADCKIKDNDGSIPYMMTMRGANLNKRSKYLQKKNCTL